jgi:exonuclease SbcC
VVAHFNEETSNLRRAIQVTWVSETELGAEPVGLTPLKTAIEEWDREVKDLRGRKDSATARLQAIVKAERDLREKLQAQAKAEKALSEIPSGFDQAKYDELAAIAKRLKPVSKRGVEIENELTRRPEWSARLLESERRWAELDERWAEDQKKLVKLKFSPEAHAKIVQDYEDAAAEDRNAERAQAAAQADLAGAEGQARSAREREEEFHRKLALLREKQSQRLYLRTLTEAMEGLRLELNARVRPELEAVASDLLSDLTDGRYSVLELTEQYEPIIVEEGERKVVISGGEEDVTQLCLRLAISRMIADRSGQPLSLLVLDEIFGSLDATRRDNVVTLLQNLKGIFEQIVLITHIESIHDVVDQCLWVSYDPATRSSRVEEARDTLPLSPEDLGGVSEAA